MTTGRVKFLSRSALIGADGADGMASSGGNSVSNLLSFDRGGYWQSNDSNDGEESTISLQFSSPKSIDRLLLVDTNFKNVSVSLQGASFNNVKDINNNAVNPSSIVNANRTIYLEFPRVLVSGITIIVGHTIVPNERKFLRQVIACEEIGTFIGWPEVSSFNESQNTIVHKATTGAKNVVKQLRTIDTFNLRFKHYPEEYDIALSEKIYQWPEKSFTLWPCGGGYGEERFLFEQHGWRLQDIYNVQTIGTKPHRWWRNFYKSGAETTLRMIEVI